MSFTGLNGTTLFEFFPTMEDMHFYSNCSAWGEWFATYFLPSPWNGTEFLDGDVGTIFKLFDLSVPSNWSMPGDWTMVDYRAQVLAWYGFNYFYE